MAASDSAAAAGASAVEMDIMPGSDANTRPLPTPDAPLAAPALVLEGLRQSYGPIVAVDDVSLSLSEGEIVALVGHSGSGKSSLLRLIAGLDTPEAGRIVLGGRDVTHPFVPPERRGVGMMFQDYALFPHLTVLANLTFGLKRRRGAKARARARDALAHIGLAKRESDYPHRLSGGEQQRVALARALLPQPRILLMDEPFSNLDRRTRDVIREETFTTLRANAATAIVVTHDPDDATHMADRIMLMHRGRIVETGTAEDIYRRPTSLLAARFFSDFNEISGVCRGGVIETAFGTFAAKRISDGDAAVVCVRPHDLVLNHDGKGPVTGTVVSCAFHGDSQRISVAVEGNATQLVVETPLGSAPPVGQSVGIAVAAAAPPVFPAE